MEYEEFIAQVADEADIGFIDADIATEAFLESLSERLPAAKIRALAQQLPQELADYLSQGQMIDLSLAAGGFFEHIGRAEGRDLPQARDHARIVWKVLRQAVTDGDTHNLLASLPGEVVSELS